MTEAPPNATVCNTTVLLNFAHIDELDLVVTLPRVVTVPVVKQELVEGAATHSYLQTAVDRLETALPVVNPSPAAQSLEQDLQTTLDTGEAQAVAVAAAADGTVVTDDGDARRVATRRDIGLTGSIGLLVRFVEDGDLTAPTADTYLKRWIDEAGFHSPAREIETFLDP